MPVTACTETVTPSTGKSIHNDPEPDEKDELAGIRTVTRMRSGTTRVGISTDNSRSASIMAAVGPRIAKQTGRT